MNKIIIKDLYEDAISDYEIASNEDARFKAMRQMAELERTAIELYGEQFYSELEILKDDLINKNAEKSLAELT